MAMGKIFANLGAGISKHAGDLADSSNLKKIFLGDKNHYAKVRAEADRKLQKKGDKRGLKNVTEDFASMSKRNVSSYLKAQDLNYKDTEHLRTKARIARGTMAGAAVGTAVLAPRYLSGGNATMNNKGEKDIAGIPFV